MLQYIHLMSQECTGFLPFLQDIYEISAKSRKILVKSHKHSCKNWVGANHHGGGRLLKMLHRHLFHPNQRYRQKKGHKKSASLHFFQNEGIFMQLDELDKLDKITLA